VTKKTQAMDGPVSLAPWMEKERLAEKTSKTGWFIFAEALKRDSGFDAAHGNQIGQNRT